MTAGRNPAGGKGPDFGHAGDGGKREGMAGTARPNYPDGHMPTVKVRQLQNRLWAAAKQSKGRRFHALYDRIYRSDVLWEAWERVRANRGAAGVDRLTLSAVEAYGVAAYARLSSKKPSVQAPTARHQCAGWRYQSPTGPNARWASRLSQTGCASRRPRSSSNLSSRPTSCPAASGSARSGRPPTPWRRSESAFPEGKQFVFEADIKDFFGSIDHERLLSLVGRAGVGPPGAQVAATVVACWGAGRWGGLQDGHGDASRWGHLTFVGQHLPARL